MNEQEWLEIFGDNLRELLRDAGITQRELADELGLSEAAVSSYIHKTKMPSVKTLVNIAYVLDCSVDDLVDFGDMIK